MTLPTGRNRTYSSGTPVASQDMNDIQDAIIGGEHGERIVQLHPINQQALGGAPTAYHSYWQTTTVNDTVTYTSSKLCVGDRIKEVRAYVHENSGNAIAVSVSEHSAKDDTQSVLDSGASPGAGTFQEVVLNGGSLPFTLTAGVTVRVTVGDVAGGTVGRKYFLVELTVDHP